MKLALSVLAANVVITFAAMAASAQQPAIPKAPAAGEQRNRILQRGSTATGQLLRVDTTARTLTIRTATNQQLRFNYTDHTKVTGNEKTVAGLATLVGTQVKVTYVTQGHDNIAAEIRVQKKPST
jgi:hypothetical protein